MSGLFRNQKVLGCSSCNGLGETTQEDLVRWQNGDFTWKDLGWCMANWQTVVGAITIATPIGIPLLAYGSWSMGGRLRMHPKVPMVSPDLARIWPCVKEEDQKKVNDKAAALDALPFNTPVDPNKNTSIIDDVIPTTKSGRTQLFTLAAVAGIVAIIYMKSRGERRTRFAPPPRTAYKSSGSFRPRKRRRRTNR
jgi:hypothetical protein